MRSLNGARKQSCGQGFTAESKSSKYRVNEPLPKGKLLAQGCQHNGYQSCETSCPFPDECRMSARDLDGRKARGSR